MTSELHVTTSYRSSFVEDLSDSDRFEQACIVPQLSEESTSSVETNGHKAPMQPCCSLEGHYCYPRKIDWVIKNAIFIAHHIGK